MRKIDNEQLLVTRLRQMIELLERERSAIVSADTDDLEMIASKKQELTNILATVSPELMSTLKQAEGENVDSIVQEIRELITQSSVKNSINGSMLTQARNMTEKSIGILLSCTDRHPVELYDEQGRVPDSAKKRALGAA